MTPTEQVTDYKIEKDKPISGLIRALNEHFKKNRPDLYRQFDWGFSTGAAIEYGDQKDEIPDGWRWLIAFTVEGGSEGHIVHVGAMYTTTSSFVPGPKRSVPEYLEFGICKILTEDQTCYAICKEAQRFLTAVVWN